MRYQSSRSTSAGIVNQALSRPSGCSAVGSPKASRRTTECSPSAPMTTVEAAGISLFEADQHTVWSCLQIRDRVVEQVAHARTSRLIEDCSEIAAENLVSRHDAPATKGVDRHLGAVPSGCVHPSDSTLGQGPGADLAQQTHPVHDGAPGTAKINGLSTRAWSRCPFDDGNRKASLA